MSIGTAIPRNSVTSKAVWQEKLTEIITNLMSTVDNCLTDDEIRSFSHLLTKYRMSYLFLMEILGDLN